MGEAAGNFSRAPLEFSLQRVFSGERTPKRELQRRGVREKMERQGFSELPPNGSISTRRRCRIARLLYLAHSVLTATEGSPRERNTNMTQAPTITRSMLEEDIALLTFDTPNKGANVLSKSVLQELSDHLDALEAEKGLAGLILASGKPSIFIAGADLREFVASFGAPVEEVQALCQRGQTLFARLSALPLVSVAAIDGICVGGGAELAIWCDRRIMTPSPKTEFGFPEVKLGLFPGWGGTVRMPRVAGLGNAVEMITGGESIDAEAAFAMGLISDVAPSDDLLAAAVRLVREEQASGEYLEDRKTWRQPVEISETELGFLAATASAMIGQQTHGQYPAPEAALETMLESAAVGAEEACQMEAEGMSQLFGSPVNRALLNVFMITDRNKKDSGLEAKNVKAEKIEHIGVLGAGIMGAGISAANVRRGVAISIFDANPEALARGAKSVVEEAAYDRKTKGVSAEKAVTIAPLLNVASKLEELAGCKLVIEAVVEKADVKKQIFAQLEPLMPPDAILASNTSTLPITDLAAGLEHPERFCGIHFFNPVRRMKLVEVIRGEKTSDETVATAVAHMKKIGKMPVVVGDGPGFLVNRLLFPYMNEALELLLDGVPMKDIERAATKFGMPMGPFTLYDLVGLDTAAYAGNTMWTAFPERTLLNPLLPHMVKRGRLGRKTGVGFFSYQNKKGKKTPDPEFDAILKDYKRGEASFTPEELTARLFLPMLLEATRVLTDNIARNPRDVDLGLIYGFGFPPFRGGVLFWADTLGPQKILEMLKPFASLGPRLAPTELLLEMAASGKKFYDQPA